MTQEYRFDLDLKDRVTIPAKVRKGLGSQLILCLAPDDERGLNAFTPEAWQAFMKLTDAQSLTAQQRFMMMHAEVVEIDNQGRIHIPQCYIEALHIERGVTIWFMFG